MDASKVGGSNIPKARSIIQGLIDDIAPERGFKLYVLHEALALMTRAPAKRRARPQPNSSTVTPEQKARILELAQNRNMTCAHIATAVGLPSSASGRVSEVLHGLR